MEGLELAKMTETQMAERVSMARFPQELTAPQRKVIAKIAIEYGLDPLMGELLIMHGTLYVPLSARLRKAQETGRFDGINTRPATPEEIEGRKYTNDDYLWVAEVWVKGSSHPFIGFGGVKKKEFSIFLQTVIQYGLDSHDLYIEPLENDQDHSDQNQAYPQLP